MRYFPWRAKRKALLGLAFDSMSVQILGLNQPQPQQYAMEAIGSAPVAASVIVDNDIREPEALAQSIRLAHQRSGSRLKHVAVAMPSTRIIHKYLTLNRTLSDDALFAHILLEASQLVPYALTDVALDYQRLSSPVSDTPQQQVLLVCSRQTHINMLDNVVRLAGLIPSIIDVDTFALVRACTRLLPLLGLTTTSHIVIITSTSTTFNFMCLHHQIIFTREETVGTANTNSPPILGTSVLTLRQTYAPLLAFMSRSLQFFESHYPGQVIEHILLCGLPLGGDEITHHIQETTGITCSVINPLMGISGASALLTTTSDYHSTAMALACGLAMRYPDDTLH